MIDDIHEVDAIEDDGDFIRDIVEDEGEYDAELAADHILAQQELEDFEGLQFENYPDSDLWNEW